MMQDPGRYDFTIYQGASFDRTFTWQVGDPATLVNLTNYTGRMQVRSTIGAPTVVVELTTSNGRMTLGGALGTIALAITPSDTAALAPGQYVYDMEMVSSGGEVTRLLEGRATVSAEVTR
jgi:hypothetical protein